MNNGYIEIRVGKNSWKYAHRIVAAKKLGRPLKNEEEVHHVDGVRTNNDPDNLWVFATASDHTRFHKTGIAIKGPDGVYTSPAMPKNRNGQILKTSCIACGRPCHNKYCSHSCSQLDRTTKAKPTREGLAELLAMYSMNSVAAMCSVTFSTVKKWAKGYGLQYRRANPRKKQQWTCGLDGDGYHCLYPCIRRQNDLSA